MNLHQVLTGAVNPGDNCFSVGSVGGHPFTAYASGCDVVILGTDFERLQIIPGAKHGNIQVGCVDCSMQQGKIAASYGNVICIFEPVQHFKQKNIQHTGLHYQWQKSDQISLENVVHNLTWDPTGSRLLTGSSCLQLWSNISFENVLEEENPEKADSQNWRVIWQCKTASEVHLMKFSPDGEFFATAGKDDCLVKVWYNTDSWKAAVASESRTPETTIQEVGFSFIYLVHPRSVNGFSWRKTSKYMPRGAVCNVLLTCCKDNICRLWAETLLPNDSLLYGGGYNHCPEPVKLNNNFKRNASSKESMKNALELNLRPFRRGRRRSLALAHTGYLPHQQDPHEVHRNTPLQSNALCHFHIAASINPVTDIPLLPSIMSLSLNENEEKSGPFVVHWLNNKELHFTLSMEVFLQQLKKSFEHISSEASTEESNQMDIKSDEETDDTRQDQKGNKEQRELADEKPVSNSSYVPLSPAAIDHEIEIQLSEWNRNADMLFSIHPMDGSLLVWHVDWLDEYQPGMFRQVQVSFVSRIPVAFPTGDANSLCRSIVMYACTKNVELALQQGKQKPSSLGRSCSMLISSGHSKSSNSLKLSIFTPNVMMISKHADGSLNQWLVSFAEESAFSVVLSISHKSRYCGHRFHLNDLACHSVLPLLLTTSHHNAVKMPVVDSTKETLSTVHSKDNASTSQDLNAVYSELILWRVDPVGPLSFSGGVSELARINSLHVSAFSNVAWLPTLIPSYCLGAYCNSPSACFVASDGQHLRLYQAIIDARKLLGELSNPGISKYVGEVFNIISQQSTARPGCIVELDAITELHGGKMQLLHVFQEDFILNNHENRLSEKKAMLRDSAEGASRAQAPSSIPLQVAVASHGTDCSQASSSRGCRGISKASSTLGWFCFVSSDSESEGEIRDDVPAPIPGPSTLHKDRASLGAEAESSPLDPETEKILQNNPDLVYDSLTNRFLMQVDPKAFTPRSSTLQVRVQVHRAASPSPPQSCRGHTRSRSPSPPRARDRHARTHRSRRDRSRSLTPRSRSPSVVSVHEKIELKESEILQEELYSSSPDQEKTQCSFTKKYQACKENLQSTSQLALSSEIVYSQQLNLPEGVEIISVKPSAGTPLEISCAHTNRLAVAYKRTPLKNSRCSQDFLVNVGIFECESTGGACWILEQTLHLDELNPTLDCLDIDCSSSVNKNDNFMLRAKHVVHLDWMSREDGSHILTLGIGSKLHMFGQLAGKIQEQSGKEMFVLPVWENAKTSCSSRFILLRCVDLVSSVEGSPPLPVSLSWVRDGILVVGMDCEMHVYSQWQPLSKQDTTTGDSYSGSTPSIISLMKQGQSPGVHSTKRTLTRSMTSLAQKLSGKRTAFDLSLEMEDSGLFEAAHSLCPTLPQYHPLQLLELMDLGKVRRAKAILSHLVKCIAGEVIAINDPDHEKRCRSLSICASGSSTRDPMTFSRGVITDYTEIDSVPPLPLYALLAADEECSYACTEKANNQRNLKNHDLPDENYEDLFQNSNLHTDDLTMFEEEEEDKKTTVIDLSQYSPTYFGPEHAQVLSRHLLHSSLPGLTRMEQMSLMALADTIAITSTDIGESRDRSKGGETLDECGLKFLLAVRLHTFMTTSLPPAHRAQLLHQGLSSSHFAWAFHSVAEEELLNVLPAMQKHDPTWSELRAMGVGWWVRNTHSLRRCIEKVAKAAFQRNNDPLDAAIFYLAMKKKAVIWGLYRSIKDTKMTQFFGQNFTEDRWRKAALKNAFSLLGKQRFEHSAAFFLLAGHLKDAVEVCLEKLNDIQLALVIARLYESEFEIAGTYKSILQKRILGKRPHSTESPSNAHVDPFLRSMAYWILEDYSNALDTLISQPILDEEGENALADEINLAERRLFFTTAYAHLKAGCPMLALEVLSKMPKVVKKSKPLHRTSSLRDTSKGCSPCSPVLMETKDDKSFSIDWSQPVINGLESSSDGSSGKQSNSALFDWSQPSTVFHDEPLEIKWDSDKDEDSEDSCLVMKPVEKTVSEKPNEVSSSYTETYSSGIENDVLTLSEDIISAQLKFRACLKILTVELRTLSTGYEIDGGKLRYQLYHWLEREVVALQKTCDYSVDAENVQSRIIPVMDDASLSEMTDEASDIQQNMLSQRRQWLVKYQSLLRMFLSYCILHGSHGGGLASVRMELILLLQESQQIHVMHTLAASLSACIYQSLCGGHNYSSLQANQFTGTVYQTLLLSHRHSLRTTSSDETITPNIAPAQWPGVETLIQLLTYAGEDVQSGITVLLCEILTAVYLSLFIHGLATHSSNELYRIMAHPLNDKMWFAVFGGGAKIPKKGQIQQTTKIASSPVDDGEKQHKRFRLSSKSSSKESSQTTLPSVELDTPNYKEKFIPPELSIWDYFIAKSLEDQSEHIKSTSMEDTGINKIETDMGYPGSKARIIHKESDIITAFAVNKANRNCIAIASSHDIQELDVSGILATQFYTWVDDDEVEAKGADDFLVIHARDDLGNIQGTTPYTHSNPGTPINMPWLGSTQTGRGAAVVS
ncbi:hypothetical protein JD844_008947 [Phrynosoma platyrhinos]|uniref:RAVE complex protein Rav1 C-terminal domain-containing protein n=1 Tax=Phrynosoma platyrhinos TaxID=52577 RepID=A0ABQ7TF27_PHRPL|nr:hypothetical protein JD844_008947 [Phrynosoma platyrhinos]